MTISRKGLIAAIVVCGLLALYKVFSILQTALPALAYRLLSAPEAQSIGIIGGADGPTAIFTTYRFLPYTFALLPMATELFVFLYVLFRSAKALRRYKPPVAPQTDGEHE